MSRERDLKLEKYRISGNRYRELKYFCRQYREKQARLRELTEVAAAAMQEGGRNGKVSDITADTAIRREALQKDLDSIEQAAMETDAELYGYIIRNVTDGIPYEYLGVPMGRRQFYKMRRKFFFILSEKKGH